MGCCALSYLRCRWGLKRTALPAADEARAEELAAFCFAGTGDRMLREEIVEFGYGLEEIAEGKEAAVERPGRAGHVGDARGVAVTTEEHDALSDRLLTWVWGVEALDCGLRDAV